MPGQNATSSCTPQGRLCRLIPKVMTLFADTETKWQTYVPSLSLLPPPRSRIQCLSAARLPPLMHARPLPLLRQHRRLSRILTLPLCLRLLCCPWAEGARATVLCRHLKDARGRRAAAAALAARTDCPLVTKIPFRGRLPHLHALCPPLNRRLTSPKSQTFIRATGIPTELIGPRRWKIASATILTVMSSALPFPPTLHRQGVAGATPI